ncbi:MAG: glycerol-3-phosphate 1-O-acyltransferase PlsY [bacterium]
MNSSWVWIAVGFLCGSVPFGYLVGRMNGVDVRKIGSGNVGATNVFRALGKKWGSAVLILDVLKGFLPVQGAIMNLRGQSSADAFIVLVGVAAVLGHSFTPFLKFKGGKGVATSAGALLAIMPAALGVTAMMWGLVWLVSRYVSLASIVAALVFPVLAFFFYRDQTWFVVAAFVMCVLVIVRHWSNIQRLWNGTEQKWGKRREH